MRFKQFEALVNAQKLAFFAVDEAHCVVEDTYREQYRHLDYLVSQLQVQDGPVAPMVALTATAPPEMARRIVRALKLRSPHLELRTPRPPEQPRPPEDRGDGLDEGRGGPRRRPAARRS